LEVEVGKDVKVAVVDELVELLRLDLVELFILDFVELLRL
jgi:hypothetical protein